jgi:hypothetical protein
VKFPSLPEIRKAVTVVVGAAAVIVATGQLNGYTHVLAIINDVIAVATALGVYVVPNAEPVQPAHAAPPAA